MPCAAKDFGLALNLQCLSLSCSGFRLIAPRRAPNAPREGERVPDTTSSRASNLASCCYAEQSRSSDRKQGRWRTFEEAEFAPLRWIHWYYNTRRIRGYPGNIPPPEYEDDDYRQNVPTEPVRTQTPESL
jgi:transposase InsO family protein